MKSKITHSLIIILFILLSIRFFPLSHVNWGKIEMLPGSAITVTGESQQQIANQVARFSASVTITDEDKQTAVNEVNQKMTDIIKVVKDFGIDDQDIQTQNVSVSEIKDRSPEFFLDAQTGWRASNSISLTLRDIDKASSLTDLLTSLEATNISGPRFSVENTQTAEIDLLASAIENAREKAQKMAQASGRKLGKVLSVSEGYTSQPGIFRSAVMESSAGLPAPIEPGSQIVSKTVTVVFELN